MPDPVPTQALDHRSGTAPFLKWLGGKRWLLRDGLEVPVLHPTATYFEPFVGAGSMFFALNPAQAVLGDINKELVVTYVGVRDHLDDVLRRLRYLANDLETYNRVKRMRPRTVVGHTARFIYLNRTAYGGVYRVNRRGEFNVPFGHYTDRLICQTEVLTQSSAALQNASITQGSFEATARTAKAGDFVYLDPPYNAGFGRHGELFDRYHSTIFGWEAHRRLAKFAEDLNDRGVFVLVSNSGHPDVAALYRDFEVRTVKRKSMLSRDPVSRGFAEETLYSNF